MPELLVLRHAKSAWDTDAPTDFDRPLAARGRRAAQRMGVWFRKRGMRPDLVLCSPAARARETWERVAAAAWGEGPPEVRFEPAIYGAGPSGLAELLREVPEALGRVMLIGHNPGLEMLIAHLAEDSLAVPAGVKPMPTAACARFTLPDAWPGLTAGSARLEEIVRPREL